MNLKKILDGVKKNEFISSSLLYIFASFFLKGVSFITTPIFTRMMGSADYGAVSNFTTYANILTTFLCLQVSSGLLTAKINYAGDRFRSYMKNVVTFALGSALFFSALVIVFRAPLARLMKIDVELIPFLCLMSFGLAMNNLLAAYFIAKGVPKHKVWYSIITALGIIASGLIFVALSEDKSHGRIFGYVLSYSCVALFALFHFLSYKEGEGEKKKFKEDIRYALAFGVPLIPHLLANLVNGSADKIFIVNLCGESQNGIYTIAYNIGQLALVFASACSDAWNPWYFKKTKALDGVEDRREGNREIARYFKLYTLTIGMCFVGVMLLSPEIMALMAPPEYHSGTTCILYVSLGVFFLFLYRFPLGYEQFRSNTKLVAPATILAALVNLGLNAILIPKFGINGAALATTLSYVVLLLFHEVVARRIVKGYNIHPIHYLPSVLAASAAFLLALIFLESMWIRFALLALFCLAYLFVLLGIFKKNVKNKGEISNG